jgi:hypothetical protein
MKPKRRRALATLLAAVAVAVLPRDARAAESPALVDGVAARLARPPVLRGRFEQDKRIAGFTQVLHSRGEFLLAAGSGVIWTTREPFAAELRLSRDALVSTQDGAVVMSLDAAREPGLRAINQLLFALLAGDVATLARQFRVDGAVTAERWSLTLVPLDPGMAKVLTKIALAGDRLVESVELDEANGDHTRIRFLEQSSTPAALTAAERARFDAH